MTEAENPTDEGAFSLNPVECRVLGCLLEKERTTPEYYPLSLNALTNACNQKSNRRPVMSLDESTVREATDTLREKRMAMMFHGADARVPKFKHTISNLFDLDGAETAILCELLLRGPQTPGELRSRGERMHRFDGLAEVETALKSLLEYPVNPLIIQLPRRPGQKEQRYAHLLSGDPTVDDLPEGQDEGGTFESPNPPDAQKLEELEREVGQLRSEVAELRAELERFKQQFE